MNDPRLSFLSQIDLAKTRVRAFEGFILLCGGESVAQPTPIKSVRHLIHSELTNGRHDLAHRIRLAEETQDWFDGGVYSDLLTFEEHLAGLSAVIVLVVETPGSIAELGAFSVGEPFLDRLLVIVSNHHYEQDSFIRLGPINKIANNSSNAVLVYDWERPIYGGRPASDFQVVSDELEEIVRSIREHVSPSRKEHAFKPEEPSHTMSLICDLCDLFGALSEKDIADFLVKLGIHIESVVVTQYIFLLIKCGMLFSKRKGHGTYYYVRDWKSRVSFGLAPNYKFYRERIQVDTLSYYEKEIPSRSDVVKAIRRSR